MQTDDFYCRSYCLLNMFQAPLCTSSGAREYYTEGGIWCFTAPNNTGSNHLYNSLELLMMGIMVAETC